jgi:hypothetical protein
VLRPGFAQRVAGPRLQVAPVQTPVLLEFDNELNSFGAQTMRLVRAMALETSNRRRRECGNHSTALVSQLCNRSHLGINASGLNEANAEQWLGSLLLKKFGLPMAALKSAAE